MKGLQIERVEGVSGCMCCGYCYSRFI